MIDEACPAARRVAFDQRVYCRLAPIPQGPPRHLWPGCRLDRAYGCARQVGWSLRRSRPASPVPGTWVVSARGQISMSLSREGSDWISASC